MKQEIISPTKRGILTEPLICFAEP